mmetsp:Transcript_149496/g.212568  ORF Transcript_149496/g.212568 Transcript_149496/m.212568 type:complete len:129 (+) Transcript_149496:407-793(+)
MAQGIMPVFHQASAQARGAFHDYKNGTSDYTSLKDIHFKVPNCCGDVWDKIFKRKKLEAPVTCPQCHHDVTPNVQSKCGKGTTACCIFWCCLGSGMCWCPMFVDECWDHHFICPNCNHTIEVDKYLLK